MINLLQKDSLQTFWLGFHVLLGVAATYIPGLLIAWIYFLIASALLDLVIKGNSRGVVHNFLAYYLGMEIMARAIKASPLVPYESGKYTMVLFLLAGLILSTNRTKYNLAGWLILLLSVPALFVERETFGYRDLVFNYLGLLNLALAVIYFYSTRLSKPDLVRLFRLSVYSIIPLMVSVTLKTPDFDDLTFSLSASSETTGGFGSNQVSTILGVAFLLIGYCYFTGQKIFKSNWVAIVLFCLFFFRGLLTFSRGGVISGVLALLLVFIASYFWPMRTRFRGSTFTWTFLIFAILLGISIYANQLTDNTLALRYQGETEATLKGRRVKDLSLMTSGRLDIFLSDLDIWNNNFLVGVGPGRSSEIREEQEGVRVSAHVEISRLLSEHGLMGLLISIILIGYPVISFFQSSRNSDRLFKLCLFSFALLTSFHSAMRTNVTPYLYGLATTTIIYDFDLKKRWYSYLLRRKQTVEMG